MLFQKPIRKNKHFSECQQIITIRNALLFQQQNSLRRFIEILEERRFGHFGKLTGKLVFETTSKTSLSFEAKKSPELFSSRFSANTNRQNNLYTTRYLQTPHSSPSMEIITNDIPTSNSLENTRRLLNNTQNDEVVRRNPQSNTLHQNGRGIHNEKKSCPPVGTKRSTDENVLCLERCIHPSPHATSLPETTPETSDGKRHCKSIGQSWVRNFSSTKHKKIAQDTKNFIVTSARNALRKTRISPNT